MKDKIVDIESKKFLMNFSDNSFLEIVDYNELLVPGKRF